MLDYLTYLSGDGNMEDTCKSLGRQTLSSRVCAAKSCPDGAAFYYNCKTFALYVGGSRANNLFLQVMNSVLPVFWTDRWSTYGR